MELELFQEIKLDSSSGHLEGKPGGAKRSELHRKWGPWSCLCLLVLHPDGPFSLSILPLHVPFLKDAQTGWGDTHKGVGRVTWASGDVHVVAVRPDARFDQWS